MVILLVQTSVCTPFLNWLFNLGLLYAEPNDVFRYTLVGPLNEAVNLDRTAIIIPTFCPLTPLSLPGCTLPVPTMIVRTINHVRVLNPKSNGTANVDTLTKTTYHTKGGGNDPSHALESEGRRGQVGVREWVETPFYQSTRLVLIPQLILDVS